MKDKDLHNKKNSGFKTPKDYFESFENRLFEKINDGTVDFPKEEGYKVPEGYFTSFEDRLFDTIAKEEEKTVPVISINRKRKITSYLVYAAATILLFIAIFGINSGGTDPFSTVTDAEVNEFIDNDLLAMNEYEMLSIFAEDDIEVSEVADLQFDTNDVIDYLENNMDSYDDILTE